MKLTLIFKDRSCFIVLHCSFRRFLYPLQLPVLRVHCQLFPYEKLLQIVPVFESQVTILYNAQLRPSFGSKGPRKDMHSLYASEHFRWIIYSIQRNQARCRSFQVNARRHDVFYDFMMSFRLNLIMAFRNENFKNMWVTPKADVQMYIGSLVSAGGSLLRIIRNAGPIYRTLLCAPKFFVTFSVAYFLIIRKLEIRNWKWHLLHRYVLHRIRVFSNANV